MKQIVTIQKKPSKTKPQANKNPHKTVEKKLLPIVQSLTEYSALVLDE